MLMFRNVKIVHTEVEDGKYNDKKEKSLHISFQKESKILHLFFKDNGMGLQSKYKKRIFKKCSRKSLTPKDLGPPGVPPRNVSR